VVKNSRRFRAQNPTPYLLGVAESPQHLVLEHLLLNIALSIAKTDSILILPCDIDLTNNGVHQMLKESTSQKVHSVVVAMVSSMKDSMTNLEQLLQTLLFRFQPFSSHLASQLVSLLIEINLVFQI
jgi:hypothetical protein